MTIGTALVICVAIICGTFLSACILGTIIGVHKAKEAKKLAENFSKEFRDNPFRANTRK